MDKQSVEQRTDSSSKRLKQAEQDLLAERENLLSELAAGARSPDELADGWQDRDSASESEIRDVEFDHRGALRQRILEIGRAIERIKLNTYGRCVQCERAIKTARLAEDPAVSLCLACRREFEDTSRVSTPWREAKPIAS